MDNAGISQTAENVSFSIKSEKIDIYRFLGRLDDIELSSTKRRHRNSTGSPNEDEQSTDDENSDTDNSLNSDSDSGEDSDFSDSEGSESEIGVIRPTNNNNKTDSLFETLMCELDNAPDHEVDPFHHDFSSAGLSRLLSPNY